MTQTNCNLCGNSTAVNDSIKVEGIIYCENCFRESFSEKDSLNNKSVQKQIDPTVCSFCNKDNQNVELSKISIYPICNDCSLNIRNKTFPTWVKVFLGAIGVIIIGSFIWNWKFYSAYNDIQNANEFFSRGDYKSAASLMTDASRKVPEVEDIKTISIYFKGIQLLSQDKSSAALLEFEKCKNNVPVDYNIDNLILQAKIGASFDHQNYHEFLDTTKQYLQIDSTSAMSWAGVASAYSCLYITEGKQEDKNNAIKYINKAQKIDNKTKDLKSYYNMIEYRMETKKIIKIEDFNKQYPNGWTKI